jgi:predicted ATPase
LNIVKLRLGGSPYHAFDAAELEKNLFTVVNLLESNAGMDSTVLSFQQPLEGAMFLLRAGVKAMENDAFDTAMGYLSTGINLLPESYWQDYNRLSLDLFSLAAGAFFCSGSVEVYKYCQEVIQLENRPILVKQRAYMVLIDATGATGSNSRP